MLAERKKSVMQELPLASVAAIVFFLALVMWMATLLCSILAFMFARLFLKFNAQSLDRALRNPSVAEESLETATEEMDAARRYRTIGGVLLILWVLLTVTTIAYWNDIVGFVAYFLRELGS